MTSLGTRIRDRRTELGLSQDDLAQITGYGRSVVSLWENDKRVPTQRAWESLARALDVSDHDEVTWLWDTELITPKRRSPKRV